MKKIFTSVLVAVCGFQALAQQDPQFSQTPFTRLSTNPGYAGASEFLCLTLLNRQQWVGFDGAPKTSLITLDSPIKINDKHTIGVGATIIGDKLGFESTFSGKVALAYRLPLGGNGGSLGIGIDAGLLNKSINGKWVALDDPQQDVNIPKATVSDKTLDLSFGLHYHIPNKLFVGLSATHLNAGKLSGTNLAYTMARHIYLTGGYQHDISPTLSIRPNLLVKTDFASTQIDINASMYYNNQVWFGLSYRTVDAIVPMLGFQKTIMEGKANFRIGYSYDFTTSVIRTYSSGTHEIMGGFCYNIVPPKKITRYKNTRFL